MIFMNMKSHYISISFIFISVVIIAFFYFSDNGIMKYAGHIPVSSQRFKFPKDNVNLLTHPGEYSCSGIPQEIDPYEKGGPRSRVSTGVYPDCAELHLSNTSALPLVALVSFPGSGNTWVRHLIQQLTGIYTGSIYNDMSLKEGGFKGESIRDSRVVAIKTHRMWSNCTQNKRCINFQKAILIVRSPHEAILAEFNRQMTRSHAAVANMKVYNTTRWQKFGIANVKTWLKQVKSWTNENIYANMSCDLLILSYRSLKENLPEQLVKLGRFLGVKESYLHGKHMECVINNSEGKFLRKQSGNTLPKVYNQTTKEYLNTYMLKAKDVLKKALNVDISF